MSSPEAEALWQSFRDARAEAPPFDLVQERDLASQSGEIIPTPSGVAYRPGVIAGVGVLHVVPPMATSDAPILWIHGGAFTQMSPHTHRHWAGHLAVDLHRPVVLPDYCLAPEHPFPAALDEVLAVYEALVADHPDEPIVVVGDSAGGALAVGLQLRLSLSAGMQPALTLLVCPWLDLTLGAPSISGNSEVDVVLRAETLEIHAAAYLDGTAPTDPLASPVHADVSGIGTVVIMAAEYDLLIDDSLRFARRCSAAGVDVALEIAAEMPHCYQFFVGVIPEADAALRRTAEKIRERLDQPV